LVYVCCYKDKIFIEAQNELLYKFQEDLLLKDFENFKEFFIDEYFRLSGELDQTDIHPDILKKYKNDILIKLDTSKFNI
jgi:hypothetical protein